jgi:hypothetical protein
VALCERESNADWLEELIQVQKIAKTLMENGLWYSEASLVLDDRLLRAGTLIQCARRWGKLQPEEKLRAAIKLAAPVDGVAVLQGDEIGSLASWPGYRFA